MVGAGPVPCWSCGRRQLESAVVRLADHPEVAVCLPCAHLLHERAVAYEQVGVRPLHRPAAGVLARLLARVGARPG